jgi:glutamate-1-semialdehyde 2,1-aminomutase
MVAENGLPMHVARLGGMFTPFWRVEPVHRLADAKECDVAAFGRFYHGMLARGVYLSPSQFETDFVSAAHTEADIDFALEAVQGALDEL